MKITTLIENELGCNSNLSNEHGLSFFVEVGDKKILFDTGQTGAILKNAEKLNISLGGVDYLVLSHGHYDHTGGVPSLWKKEDFKNTHVFVGNGFFKEKYKILEEKPIFIGNAFDKSTFTKEFPNTNEIQGVFKVEEGIWLIQGFKSERISKKFAIRNEKKLEIDDFSDEIAMAILTERGLVAVVGCAHPGIAIILDKIKCQLNMPIYAVVGGSHLIDEDEKRISEIMNHLDTLNIERLYLCHCTGDLAVSMLKKRYGNRFILNHTGDSIEIL